MQLFVPGKFLSTFEGNVDGGSAEGVCTIAKCRETGAVLRHAAEISKLRAFMLHARAPARAPRIQ